MRRLFCVVILVRKTKHRGTHVITLLMKGA
jgi:hypothetical protein